MHGVNLSYPGIFVLFFNTEAPCSRTRQRIRKRVEEIFGWAKTVGAFRRTRFRGTARTQLAAYIVGAAYNPTRMTRLLAAPT
jgi:hypothetical protein